MWRSSERAEPLENGIPRRTGRGRKGVFMEEKKTVQEVLDDVCLKCAEDISGTKMNPKWILFCFFRNFCTVKAGEAVPCGFPFFTVFQTIFI